MRTIKLMLLLAFGTLLFSCNDNDDEFKFDSSSLKQTKWNGTMNESYLRDGKELSFKLNVGLLFYSETDGEFSYIYEKEPSPTDGTFKYSIDGKMLIINHALQLSGHWLVVHIDKNKMILEKGTGGDDSYNATITLTRSN